MTNSTDPKTHRFIQTRTGTAAVSHEQQGIPLNAFFQNTELPENLEKAVVYQTETGPVIAKPDIVPWNDQHSTRAREHANDLRELIDNKGYYRKNLKIYAEPLSEETGRSVEEVKAIISGEFEGAYGKTPYGYLQDHRKERGLPTKADHERQQSPDIE